MLDTEQINDIFKFFESRHPNPETELNYRNDYELLVAVVLSAQCTDKRVNIVTPPFFESYPDAYALSKATFEEVLSLIKSINYPNNKSKNLIALAKQLVERFDGKVPSNIEELTSLPGVGRKTANVIASVLFDLPAMAVDTHVFRISNRIGLTKANNVAQVEKQLTEVIPEHLICKAHHWLILHGRYVCTARKPRCEICGINHICEYYEHRLIANQSQMMA
jgi:endonuclease III